MRCVVNNQNGSPNPEGIIEHRLPLYIYIAGRHTRLPYSLQLSKCNRDELNGSARRDRQWLLSPRPLLRSLIPSSSGEASHTIHMFSSSFAKHPFDGIIITSRPAARHLAHEFALGAASFHSSLIAQGVQCRFDLVTCLFGEIRW